MNPRLLIFDLDETLVHATKQRLAYDPAFQVDDYSIYVRPHLNGLLERVVPLYDLAVWSSASRTYVDAVAAQLFSDRFPLKFAWSVERCVQRVDLQSGGYVYIKDLRKAQKFGYPVDRITMVDDSPEKIVRQPQNHVRVSPFTGDPGDQGLLELHRILETRRHHG